MKKIKWFFIVLNLIMLGFASYNFLITQKMDVLSWIMVNTSSLYIAIMVLGILLSSKIIMNMALPGLFYYGTLGLFLFPWKGPSSIAQISHILMTIGIIYILFATIKKIAVLRFMIGLFIGFVIFIPLKLYQSDYLKKHQNELNRIEDPELIKKITKNL